MSPTAALPSSMGIGWPLRLPVWYVPVQNLNGFLFSSPLS